VNIWRICEISQKKKKSLNIIWPFFIYCLYWRWIFFLIVYVLISQNVCQIHGNLHTLPLNRLHHIPSMRISILRFAWFWDSHSWYLMWWVCESVTHRTIPQSSHQNMRILDSDFVSLSRILIRSFLVYDG